MFVLVRSTEEVWMLSEGITNAHWVMRRRQTSAMYCEHANEMPACCPCTLDCYCKAHSCRSPERWAMYPIPSVNPFDTIYRNPPPVTREPEPEKPALENAFAMLLRDDIVG